MVLPLCEIFLQPTFGSCACRSPVQNVRLGTLRRWKTAQSFYHLQMDEAMWTDTTRVPLRDIDQVETEAAYLEEDVERTDANDHM